MSAIEINSFNLPDEVIDKFNNTKIEAVNVGGGGQRVQRFSLAPGWRWSKDVASKVGTDSCQATHLGVVVSGSVMVEHEDGTTGAYSAGDAYAGSPGHDAWVVGQENVVAFEFAGMWGE
ncbi:MAG: hypothetical protein OR995_04895 [Candidatus Nanopelagicales bacterium]|nr:hypothetical protein [Candidatus Nanopelagicales bacterium]